MTSPISVPCEFPENYELIKDNMFPQLPDFEWKPIPEGWNIVGSYKSWQEAIPIVAASFKLKDTQGVTQVHISSFGRYDFEADIIYRFEDKCHRFSYFNRDLVKMDTVETMDDPLDDTDYIGAHFDDNCGILKPLHPETEAFIASLKQSRNDS